MEATFQFTPSTAGDFWTCWRCKAQVPNGCTHSCPTGVYPSPGVWPPSQPDPPAVKLDPFFEIQRIAGALERIAAALEKGARGDA